MEPSIPLQKLYSTLVKHHFHICFLCFPDARTLMEVLTPPSSTLSQQCYLYFLN